MEVVMSLTSRTVLLAVLLYAGGHFTFRAIQTERWERDGRAYVVFPVFVKDFLRHPKALGGILRAGTIGL